MSPGRCGLLANAILSALATALAVGCTPTYHRKDADREVYRILQKVRARELGLESLFSIEAPEQTAVAWLCRRRGLDAEALGPPAAATSETQELKDGLPVRGNVLLLALRDVLELSARHSRGYQAQKEALYLAALTLTLERHRWKPTFLASLTGARTNAPEENSKNASGTFGVSKLLALGGEATIKLTTDVAKFAVSRPRYTVGSVLTAEVVQPLLKGGGRLVARENLTQAERSLVYAVRDFARFQRTFCVQVTSAYYRVLQARDQVTNRWQNYQRVRGSRQRTEALAGAGDLAEFEVDQARQDELNARNAWVIALREYREQLDEFKVTLSLPADAPVELDPREIDKLRDAGLGVVKLTLERAIEVALARRLDLLNTKGQLEDSARHVALARNGLAPDVNVRFAASLASAQRIRELDVLAPDETGALVPVGSRTVIDRRRPLVFHTDKGTYTSALEMDLPLDRKAERNAYRSSLIDLAQALRDLDQQIDQVKLNVRQAWRNLLEAAESYRIQLASVTLAQRRVESTNILLQRGDAKPRDVLEANEDLVNAQNALTRTIVDHVLARLALWRDTELLRVGDDGVYQEGTDVD